MSLHPNGAHAAEAIANLTEALTEDVITEVNGTGEDGYGAETRPALRKELASLGLALAKTSAGDKNELLKKLERVK